MIGEENDEVVFRDNNIKGPCSGSGYGDIQCEAAHEALIEASQALLPLADYIEHNFSQGQTDEHSNELQINGYEGEL